MTLNEYIRVMGIGMRCNPMWRNPKLPADFDASAFFHHNCTFVRQDGPTTYEYTVIYSTTDSASSDIRVMKRGRRARSYVRKRDVLLQVALTAAIFELGERSVRNWAGFYYTAENVPTQAELERQYQEAYEQSWKLKKFLEGRGAGETKGPTAYTVLVSEVDEVVDVLNRLARG